jgi:hypothetical protein
MFRNRDKTVDQVCQRFNWPGMTADIEAHIRDCHRCLLRKVADPLRSPLVPILASEPMEVLLALAIFWALKRGRENMKMRWLWWTAAQNILVLFRLAIEQKATTVAKVLWQNELVQYGLITTQITLWPRPKFWINFVRPFVTFAGLLVSRRPELRHISPRGTAKWSGSAEHCSACSRP